MKKIVMFFCAMALVMPVMSCDDGGGDSKSDNKIHMAIHNQSDWIVKVDRAISGDTDLVTLWTGTAPCASEGLIPLQADDKFFAGATEGDYTPVDLPAGLFTATFSMLNTDDLDAAGCDFGASDGALLYDPDGAGPLEAQASFSASYQLEAGESYLVVFDTAIGVADKYVEVWQKLDDVWEGTLVDAE